MTWVVAGVGILGGLYGVLWILSRITVRHRHLSRDQFRRFSEALVTRGADGSILLIHHEGSDRFVQFVLREDDDGRRYLHFGFPRAPWSASYYEDLRDRFVQEGYPLGEQTTRTVPVTRFLTLDFDPDPTIAAEIAAVAFDAMAVPRSDTFMAMLEGVSDLV